MVGNYPTGSLISMLTCTATVDDFIDVIMKDHRKYIKWWECSIATNSNTKLITPQSLRVQQDR